MTINLSQVTLDFDVKAGLTSQTMPFRPTGRLHGRRRHPTTAILGIMHCTTSCVNHKEMVNEILQAAIYLSIQVVPLAEMTVQPVLC